jgi:hypothetical protein
MDSLPAEVTVLTDVNVLAVGLTADHPAHDAVYPWIEEALDGSNALLVFDHYPLRAQYIMTQNFGVEPVDARNAIQFLVQSPYWACETPHDPPEVAPIGRDPKYAITLIRSRPVDPLDDARLEPFDVDGDAGSDIVSGQFVDAVCERLAVCIESDRDCERDQIQESIESGVRNLMTSDQRSREFCRTHHQDEFLLYKNRC